MNNLIKPLALPIKQFKKIRHFSDNRIKLWSLLSFGVFLPFLLYLILYFLNEFIVDKGFILTTNEHWGFPKIWEFIAVYLGYLALVIGIIVILKLIGDVANDTEEFLEIFFEILEESKKDNELVIIAPTIMIEKKRDIISYEKYKKLLVSKINDGVKVKFAFFNTTLFSGYENLHDAAAKDNFIKSNYENDALIDFHLNFISKDFDSSEGLQNRLAFFDELISFYNQLNSSENFEYIPLDKNSYTDAKFVAVANETKGIYFLGAYKIEEHIKLGKVFDYTAARFQNIEAKNTFNQFLQGTIELLRNSSEERNVEVENDGFNEATGSIEENLTPQIEAPKTDELNIAIQQESKVIQNAETANVKVPAKTKTEE